MVRRDLLSLLKQTAAEWIEDNAPSRAASLSYYTVFSVAPLLLIAVAIAGVFLGREAVRAELAGEMQRLLGGGSAKLIEEMMASTSKMGTGVVASVAGVVLLVLGACGAFVELQDALNTMWDVDKQKTSGLLGFLKARLLSFAMIGVIAFLLLVSLIISAAISAFGHFVQEGLPGGEALYQAGNFVVSFGVITFLFAAIFKILPDAKIAWRDVWFGAAVTSLLFVIGKLLIGLYLGKTSAASSYGAAGSFAVLLIWVYYSAMIVFFGAELTHVYAQRRRDGVPSSPASPSSRASASSRSSTPLFE